MVAVFDAASSSASAGDVASLTWAHTCTGDQRLLIVGVALFDTESVSGITYNGVALTQLSFATRADIRVEFWYLVAPAEGANNVVVTPATAARLSCGAISLTLANQGGGASTFGTAATATGSSTTPSVVVTSATDQLVVDVVGAATLNALTVGAGQTERYNVWSSGAGDETTGVGSTEPGAASVTMSWSIPATKSWASVGVGVKPASPDVTVLAVVAASAWAVLTPSVLIGYTLPLTVLTAPARPPILVVEAD